MSSAITMKAYEDVRDDEARQESAPKILIADDETLNLDVMRAFLEREGYEVVTVTNSSEAIESAQQTNPDLIILDVMMPVMDGFEACRRIKENVSTSDIPVIFLSAHDEIDMKVDGLSLGANDFVAKPCRPEELLARVGVALRLKRERDRLRLAAEAAREMATSDQLTGLLNRHGMLRALARELSEARRYNRPLACLLIDVDVFKSINDTYGHLAGDAALAQVAHLLTEDVRGSDVTCRYGGEEFLIIMPETNLEGARTLGEKIRQTAQAREFGDGAHTFRLTLSVGVAELQSGESGNDMIARADVALYEAKESGRNRVVTAS